MDKDYKERLLRRAGKAMERIEGIQRKQAIALTRIEGIQSHGERRLRRLRDALKKHYQEDEDQGSG